MYDNTVSARTYISYIAESAGGFALIGRDGKLYIKAIGESATELPLKYFQDFKWGEKISISRIRYEDGIQLFEAGNTTGNTIYINQDNMFIVDQEQINNIYNQLKGLEVYSFEGNSIIDPALDIGDLLLIDGKYVIYQGSSQYSGKFKANISSKIQCKTKEELMSRTPSQKVINRRVESKIDEVEGKIEQTISEVDEQNEKISRVTQTVDELSTKISDVADVTTHGESSYATLDLKEINASEPITIKIHPINENISYLYPSLGLFPSSSTFLKVRTLRFTRTYEETDETTGQTITKTEIIDYELPDDLLFYDEETYDEFYMDYDSQTCQITKRCEYNADGTVRKLENEVIEVFEYPKIDLGDGDYTVTLLGYSYGYLFVRLMASNIYTTQFATKVELSSAITETTKNINLDVNEKLSNYSTTREMDAAIDIKANQITEKVSKVEEKTDNIDDELKTKYYTKTEANAQIETKADGITQEVSKTYSTKKETAAAKTEAIDSANGSTDNKLKNYSTTEQMRAAIKTSADTINAEVEKKVDEQTITGAYLVLKINQDTSSGKLSADKLELSATDIINLLAGNTINLTSKNIVIDSTNFKVDKDGKVIATSAILNNAKITSNSNNSNVIIENGNIATRNPSGYKGVDLDQQSVRLYSYNDKDNFIGALRSVTDATGKQLIELYADYGDVLAFGYQNKSQEGTTETRSAMRINEDNDGGITVYRAIDMKGNTLIDVKDPIIQLYYNDNSYNWGYPVIGYQSSHKYHIAWTGSQLQFYVDNTYVGTLSDKRLKTEIENIDEDFINIINEIEMKQFKIDNRNGLVSFGILAQDLIKIFKKYNKNPFDYEIVQKTQYKMEDEKVYYTINYEQFLILKQKATDIKLKALEEKDKKKDEIIADLIKRIETLEKEER